jgi:hypothetical protein
VAGLTGESEGPNRIRYELADPDLVWDYVRLLMRAATVPVAVGPFRRGNGGCCKPDVKLRSAHSANMMRSKRSSWIAEMGVNGPGGFENVTVTPIGGGGRGGSPLDFTIKVIKTN